MSKRVKKELADEEVKKLVSAFNDMIARLETSFQYIEKFSSDVSHELKTPLAIIRGESEVTLRQEREPEEYKRVIQVSLEEVQRMLKIIDDLFLLTRLDYRPEVFKFENFDLLGFFTELYEKMRIVAGEKNLEINLSIPNKPNLIKADRLHLRRLFFNLIDNAIKFTPRNGKIDIKVRYEGKQVVAAISDTGFGIPPEDLSRIFERFFHTHRKDSARAAGNGLGLSIVHSIARIHHGSVKVESELGKGSTFTVTLPLS
jgi:signal transduction histidine kinase